MHGIMYPMPRTFLQETLVTIMKSVVIVLTIVALLIAINGIYEVESSISDGSCNIAVLPIEGAILPFHGIGDYELIITPETVERFMDQVEDERGIDAVLLEINSPGVFAVATCR
jgi:ClpP class serine protease